jgi:threonine dehydrogenase-like Zn-dependent dehydrogenase
MKALHYDGPFKVSIREVEKPKLQHPDDVIIKVSLEKLADMFGIDV